MQSFSRRRRKKNLVGSMTVMKLLDSVEELGAELEGKKIESAWALRQQSPRTVGNDCALEVELLRWESLRLNSKLHRTSLRNRRDSRVA